MLYNYTNSFNSHRHVCNILNFSIRYYVSIVNELYDIFFKKKTVNSMRIIIKHTIYFYVTHNCNRSQLFNNMLWKLTVQVIPNYKFTTYKFYGNVIIWIITFCFQFLTIWWLYMFVYRVSQWKVHKLGIQISELTRKQCEQMNIKMVPGSLTSGQIQNNNPPIHLKFQNSI